MVYANLWRQPVYLDRARVTPLTTAAQQVVVSFAVAGLTGYLTSQITSRDASDGTDANPLSAVVAGYGDTSLPVRVPRDRGGRTFAPSA